MLAGMLVVACWGPIETLATYGMTWDEHSQLRLLLSNVDLATSGHSEPSAYRSRFRGQQEYYGIVNQLPGLLLWRAMQFARGEHSDFEMYDRTALAAFHTSILAFGLLAVWACSRLAGLWPGGRWASLAAPVLLLLYPRFVGHAFFNIKDVPFAAVYTLLTWQMVVALTEPTRASARHATARVLLLAGALAAMKVPGIVALWPMLAAAAAPRVLPADARPGAALRATWALSPLLALVLAVLATPAAWSKPFEWVAGAFGLFGSYPWELCTVVWGQCIAATDTPPDYLIRWFVVTTPALLAISLGWAIVESFRSLRSSLAAVPRNVDPRRAARRVGLAVVAAQMLTFPLGAIASGAALYGAERHFLFTVPAACVIGAFGLVRLVRRSAAWSGPMRVTVLASVAIATFAVAVDSWRLHPYQYAYYNEIGRRLDPSHNFETDYWGFSLAELVRRRLAVHPDQAEWKSTPFVAMPNTVYPFTPTFPARYVDTVAFGDPRWRRFPRVHQTTLVFGINRFEWRDPPPECRTIDVEQRWLLFAPKPLVLSRTMLCDPPGSR